MNSPKAIAIVALRMPQAEALAHRDQEQRQREQHGRPDVLLGGMARLRPGLLVQLLGLLVIPGPPAAGA